MSAQENPNDQTTYERKRLWIYVTIGIITIIGFVTVAAISYGIMTTQPDRFGNPVIQFPMLSWLAGILILPSALILAVHQATSGLFKPSGKTVEQEAAWQAQLPAWFRRSYVFLQNAPGIVLLCFVVAGGIALVTIDGAFSTLVRIASLFQPYIPHIVISLAAIICCMLLTFAWLKYRSRQMAEEYAFRREIFDRSGVIIVDKNSMALPQNVHGATALAGHTTPQALPAGAADAADANTTQSELADFYEIDGTGQKDNTNTTETDCDTPQPDQATAMQPSDTAPQPDQVHNSSHLNV